MSDTAVAVVATPTEAPAETPVAETPKNTGLQGVRDSVRAQTDKLFAPQEPAATEPATAQPRGPDGKFVPKPADAIASPVIEAVTPAAPAPEYTRIQLADDHPLRHRLGAEVEVPKQLEELARYAANQHTKQRQVDDALRQQKIQQATIDALNEQIVAVFGDPDVSLKYQHIKETWGEVDAQRYLQGKIAEVKQAVDAKRGEVETQTDADTVREQIKAWQTDVWTKATTDYIPGAPRPELDAAFDVAWSNYVNHVARTEQQTQQPYRLDGDEFLISFYETELKRRDGRGQFIYTGTAQAVQNALQNRNAKLREQVNADVLAQKAEAERKHLADAALRHQPRRNAPAPVADTTPVPTPVDRRSTPDQQKRGVLQRARAAGEALFRQG